MQEEKILELLSKDKLEEAVTVISNVIGDLSEDLKKEILICEMRLNYIKKNKNIGVFDEKDELKERIRITKSVLDLLADRSALPKNASSFVKERDVDRTIEKYSLQLKGIENCIAFHLKELDAWSDTIKFRDLQKKKKLQNIYVDLDFYVVPPHLNYFNEAASRFKKPIIDLVRNTEENLLILGQPGAGKTTTLKNIVRSFLDGRSFVHRFPILIRLRDLKYEEVKNEVGNIIVDKILKILGIECEFWMENENIFNLAKVIDQLPIIRVGRAIKRQKEKSSKGRRERIEMQERRFKDRCTSLQKKYNDLEDIHKDLSNRIKEVFKIELIDSLGILILVDGFDELNHNLRDAVLKGLNELNSHLFNSKVILTSRLGTIQVELENVQLYEICPLSEIQVSEFVGKWLNDPQLSSQFIEALHLKPYYDTMVRPLTLAHLCVIYEREQKIPDLPKRLYEKIIKIYIEEWDEQRSILRQQGFLDLSIRDKYKVLEKLAYRLSIKLDNTSFKVKDFKRLVKKYQNKRILRLSTPKGIARELESQTGLFIQVGYEFEFSHKSLQEYLCSRYLLDLQEQGEFPSWKKVIHIPSECALFVSNFNRHSDAEFIYVLDNVIRKLIMKDYQETAAFVKEFFDRLLLEGFVPNTDLAYSTKLLNLFTLFVWQNSEGLPNHAQVFDLLFSQSFFYKSFKRVLDYYVLTDLEVVSNHLYENITFQKRRNMHKRNNLVLKHRDALYGFELNEQSKNRRNVMPAVFVFSKKIYNDIMEIYLV